MHIHRHGMRRRMQACKTAIVIGLVFCSAGIHAESLPAPFAATYTGSKYVVFSIESKFELARYGDYFKYSLNTRGHFLFISGHLYDCSVMRISNNEYYPIEHKHTDSYDSRNDATTYFDWDHRVAHVVIGDGRKFTVKDLKQPLWDPLSLQIRIMNDVMDGKLARPKTYQLIEYGKQSQWPVHIKKTSTIQIGNADLNSDMVERTDGKSFKLWLARDFGFIPIQIELEGMRLRLSSNPGRAHQPVKPAGATAPHC